MSKIYVKFKRPRTVKDFVYKFFSENCPSGSQMGAVTTFLDKECTRVQCHANKMRSFDDLLAAVNTYFPTASPKLLIKCLLTVNIKFKSGSKTRLRLENCGDIQRTRILFHCTDCNGYFGHDKYKSKYSWEDLFLMLELKNKTQVNKYISENKDK